MLETVPEVTTEVQAVRVAEASLVTIEIPSARSVAAHLNVGSYPATVWVETAPIRARPVEVEVAEFLEET